MTMYYVIVGAMAVAVVALSAFAAEMQMPLSNPLPGPIWSRLVEVRLRLTRMAI